MSYIISSATGVLPNFIKNTATAFVMGVAIFSTSLASANVSYPSKPITMVLGFSAGGGTDALARKIAEHMQTTLGQSVIVDNKPGANGNIAGEIVARAPADGYTILYNTSSIASSPTLYAGRLKYDVLKDFKAVSRTASMPIILVVPASSQFKTVHEFVDYAKKNPGKLNYGSAGNGNVTHLAALTFESAVGIKGTHVPYKGEAPTLVDLMAGHIDYYFSTSAGAIPAVQAGRLRALAVATADRLPTLPDVPTISETVSKGLELSAWSGIMVPAGTPDAVVKKLNEAINAALSDRDVKSFFDGQSALVIPSTAVEYDKFLHEEVNSLNKIINDAGLKLQ